MAKTIGITQKRVKIIEKLNGKIEREEFETAINNKADTTHSHNLNELTGEISFLILQSPNGTKFQLEMDDNGILTTIEIEGDE